jgi:aspartyl protease family protein
MATGFMGKNSILLGLALACAAGFARAADVALIGVIGERAAVIAVGGGEPKTLKVGQRWNGITVLAVEKSRATIEVEGVKRTLALGQHHRGASAASERQSVTLAADGRGHFFAEGQINGMPVRMVVDTGATSIALPAAEAERMGLDWRKGQRGTSQTAAGPVTVYRVRFDTVRVGGIELNGVDGIVIERGRDGDVMVLTRRF